MVYLVTNKVYGCQVRRRDHLRRRDGGGFDTEEYDSHPELYMSTFGKKVRLYSYINMFVYIFDIQYMTYLTFSKLITSFM